MFTIEQDLDSGESQRGAAGSGERATRSSRTRRDSASARRAADPASFGERARGAPENARSCKIQCEVRSREEWMRDPARYCERRDRERRGADARSGEKNGATGSRCEIWQNEVRRDRERSGVPSSEEVTADG
ncbi:hypothetical protein Cni_G06931 [Canna indica]|uniref:Uncharacterized protein n=1 Tax=Canna indica TaxID=4628 RepID=A0AAQ3JXX7_9LILI|nr:hypothetical protein Cni_G06931 [Canna indica]